MKSAILEVSQSKKVKGRTYIKWVVHEIHNTTDKYNDNGISWFEEYVEQNIDTIKGMPIVVEFLDYDRSEPFGHGESGIKDGNPLFEYSVVVGVAENGCIDTIEINGEQRRALIAEGYIYNQRYPKFVKWLKSEMYDNKHPDTSVEICAKADEDVIVYKDGWREKGRIPMRYDYTGSAILGVTPADANAVVLELNNKLKNKEGDLLMDEKIITELNNKIEAKTNEVNELKNDVKNKEKEITELNQKLQEKEQLITELNSQITEKEVKITQFETELNELKAFKQESINKQLIAELNEKLSNYSDEEKAVVKDKVEVFSKSPSSEGIDEIINEINKAIVEKVIEQRKSNKTNEVNNKTKVEDIYSDIYETNSNNTVSIDELY